SGLLCNNSDFKTLLNDIWEKGKAVPVFAAGNCGSGLLGGGSDFRDANALIVGATGPNDSVANYSSSLSGSKWGVVAPGGGDGDCGPANCILSTWPQSKIKPGQAPYAWLHGTSMAAPHVAGAMAAILARQPDRSAAVSTLLANLDKIACGDGCQGRLNLAKALGVANTAPAACKASTPNPTVGPSGTTATTRRRASSAPRTTAAPAPTGPDLSETELPTTTEVTEDTAVVADDEFETAQVPSTPERPSDDDVNGPLAVLGVLGVLGVGGTAAPLVWRRFMHPG
ncbi:MAG: serine protease, partial [Actinomycetota bacterium]